MSVLTAISIAVSPLDIPPTRDGTDLYLLINDLYVFSARPLDGFPPGCIGMSDPQRTWARVGLRDTVKVELYDQFSQGGQAYLGSADIEISFASARKRTEVPYDQDDLAKAVISVCSLSVYLPWYLLTKLEFPKPIVCARAKTSHGPQEHPSSTEYQNRSTCRLV